MSPLHILQLGPYPPPEGGVTRNIVSIRDELRRRGYRCSIIATSKSRVRSTEADVHHPETPIKLLLLLARLRHDVLHLHIGGMVTGRVLALALACIVLSRRTVLTLHSGGYPLTDAGRRASPRSVRGMLFRRFSRIVAVSEAMRELFIRYGVPQERVLVVPPFSLKAPEAVPELPFELDTFVEQHSPLFVAVGGLETEYQPLFLVSSIEQIREAYPDAGLVIVGDGSLRQEAEVAVAETGQRAHIYLAGSIEHEISLELIRRCDVMVRSSLFDGDAISIREALFLGTPVVATDTGGRPDGVAVFPIGDTGRMIDLLGEALNAGKPPADAAPEDVSNIVSLVEIYEDLSRSA